MLLPVVLAILDDPSAAVSVQGAWAMHHLAIEALPAGEARSSGDSLWRELLLDTAIRLALGCCFRAPALPDPISPMDSL